MPKTSAAYPRLSFMMLLQFAVWGSWAVLIGQHMTHLGFTEFQIALVFGTTAFGSLLSPLIAGWIADRLMSAQRFAAAAHFAGAAALVAAHRQTEFGPLWTAILIHAVLYMPTIALTNAVAFRHMGDSEKFGNIRVWGTIGWIAANWALGLYLNYWEKIDPETSRVGDALLFAAGFGAVMGVYCLTLPDTPPAKEAKNPYAFLEALSLARNRNFAVLLVISFLVAIELPFYYNLTYLFFADGITGVGLAESSAAIVMSVGQVAEILVMLLLFPAVRRIGVKGTIFLGILAWPVRYAVFAVGEPTWLVVGSQALHGICFAFFFVGGMVAVERLSPSNIRASAQGLLVFATNGLGMLVGHFVSGWIHGYFALPEGGHRWSYIFLVPIALTAAAAAAFLLLFNEQQYRADAEAASQEEEERGGAS